MLQPAKFDEQARKYKESKELWKIADMMFKHYLEHTIKYVKALPGEYCWY